MCILCVNARETDSHMYIHKNITLSYNVRTRMAYKTYKTWVMMFIARVFSPLLIQKYRELVALKAEQ